MIPMIVEAIKVQFIQTYPTIIEMYFLCKHPEAKLGALGTSQLFIKGVSVELPHVDLFGIY